MKDTYEQIDVFVGGTGGIHSYRIPSLLVSPGGVLLAFCEARKLNLNDASPTDLVLRRSLDHGQTWEPLQTVVAGQGTEAIMNPCPVVDGDRVVLFCMNAHKSRHGYHRQLVVESNDDGQTWSPATDITDVLGDETFIPGPGVGIRLRTGRLLIPGYTNLYGPDGARIASYSCAVFSDDHGHSWQRGARVEYAMSNESQAVELTDGSVLINWRIQKKDDPPGCRGMARSEDGGATWSAPVLAQALNELPCQAGFMRLEPLSAAGADRLLFSNPDAHPGPGGDARTRMTVRLSLDGGRTWPLARRIHDGPSCYSCPARLPDGRIGLLYEYGEARRYERIRLARFSLDWLSAQTGGGDLRA